MVQGACKFFNPVLQVDIDVTPIKIIFLGGNWHEKRKN